MIVSPAIGGEEAADHFVSWIAAPSLVAPGHAGRRRAWLVARLKVEYIHRHAFLAAQIGRYVTGEKTLALSLYPRLRPDELLTADRNFYPFDAWASAARTGAASCGHS